MQLFERRLELWSFLLVMLCLLAAITQINQPNFLTVDAARHFKIIVELVLGNSIHIAISFYFLFTIPEMTSWLTEKFKTQFFLVFTVAALLFTAAFIFMFKFAKLNDFSEEFVVLIKFAWIFIPVFHS